MEKKLTIEEAREIINAQDQTIQRAFALRMAAAREIAARKAEQGLPIYVPEREEALLARVRAEAPAEISGYAVALQQKLMELSRAYQRKDKVYGLLGRRLSHSFSPEIHRRIGEACEPYAYQLFEVEPEDLGHFLMEAHWDGLNVTIPYKTAVMDYCDEISARAERIGAVNTLVRRGDRIFGDNTDYIGFRQMVEESGAQIAGQKCLILGSGGASKTVVCVLEDLGASAVVVVSRDGRTGCDYSQIHKHDDATVLVNTTPVGMYPETGKAAVYPGTFPKLQWVFDVIYNPLRTNLLCQARRADMETADGLTMLISQAMASAELFLHRRLDTRMVSQIAAVLRQEKQNVVLIGMPGCGKTTVGEMLACRLSRRFIDIDELITTLAGKSIPEIFHDEGEPAFRRFEMDVVESLRHETGCVIACGGGVVTQEENYYALAENGKLFFLNRPIQVLPTEGRPISQAVPLAILQAQRLPLYRSWCDAEITVGSLSAMEVADKILSELTCR